MRQTAYERCENHASYHPWVESAIKANSHQRNINKNKKFSNRDPPAACISLPIIGGLYKLNGYPPEQVLKLSRKTGKMMSIWFGDNYTVFINDPVLVEEVFVKNHEVFGDRPFLPSLRLLCDDYNDIFTSGYETWHPIRKALEPFFTKTKLKSFNQHVELHADNLVRKLKEYAQSGEPVDPYPYFKKYFFGIIIKFVLNVDLAYEESPNEGIMNTMFNPTNELVQKIASCAVFDTIHVLSPLYYHSMRSFIQKDMGAIREICKQHLIQHKSTIDKNNPRDMLDQLILLHFDDELIINLVFDLLIASVDTPSSTLAWFNLAMTNHQHEQEKVRNELRSKFSSSSDIKPTDVNKTPYTCAALKEIFRLVPPGPFGVPRLARRDINIGGYFIPKGTTVLANWHGIHRDSYENGDKYLPSRFLKDPGLSTSAGKWAPYSIGPRICLGFRLANDAEFLAISKIFHRFKVTSVDGSQLDETPRFGLSVSPKHGHLYKFDLIKQSN
ncbi:cytochrome P450 family protein [Cavenderia fasciculata]|uniref:Cytochrome P450 family protein n=1 Tax=Cavenderia fasciculata TaxID=261658 RepID=F4QF55_CACFS|nr:cytochrome P450 family protein [Cavenderia fasciculata]EGG14209.1 cytochrome P450 family protein [Cavenderia fasciculata]|eukprot:XP_004350917.1 cytochrome P450 family protein [Cavenderia fasciculata]